MQQIQTFITQAREHGLHDNEIKDLLLQAGWSVQDVAQALYGDWAQVPMPERAAAQSSPAAAATPAPIAAPNDNQPISVVQNLSTRGFEYSIMFVSLLISLFSLGTILHTFVKNMFTAAESSYYSYDSSAGTYTLAATFLLVTLPIFIVLFLRLKKAELQDPSLKKDPSRKRMSHFTQFIAFAFGVGNVVYFIYGLLNGLDDAGATTSLVQSFLHMLITLGIAGGVFAYLWRDEHATK